MNLSNLWSRGNKFMYVALFQVFILFVLDIVNKMFTIGLVGEILGGISVAILVISFIALIVTDIKYFKRWRS